MQCGLVKPYICIFRTFCLICTMLVLFIVERKGFLEKRLFEKPHETRLFILFPPQQKFEKLCFFIREAKTEEKLVGGTAN